MIHCDQNDLYKTKYVAIWSALSFKAGFINAAGFLSTGSFVSHVTGFGTQVGLSLAHADYVFGFGLFAIPVTFILGGVITSFILDRPYAKNEIPNYPVVQFIITFFLGLVAYLGAVKYFSNQTPSFSKNEELVIISLVCLVCGLKNSLTTWATGGKIRTTHLTGLSTDIGLNFLRTFKKQNHHWRYPESRKVNWIRIFTFIAFSVGSFISAIMFSYLGYRIFLIPFVMSLIFLVISIVHREIEKRERLA